LAGALLYKGHTLQDLDRSEEAIEVYDTLIQRFADAQEPRIAEYVAMARSDQEHAG
jgi:hypothetical protein